MPKPIPGDLHAAHLRALLAPIAPLLDDPAATEIMLNGPDQVFVERRGRLERTEHRFSDAAALLAALRAVAQFVGRRLGPEEPVLEAYLPDGSRVQAVIHPAAPEGPVVNIRRFARRARSLADLLRAGAVEERGAMLLERLVRERKNVLVAGGTGSGKTSLLNALSALIAPGERVVVIEDARELQLTHDHVVSLEVQPGDETGRGALDVRALLRASLRLRPDRIVIGELRGAEALELVQAMTTGHAGSMSTLHAKSPADALRRLETLAAMSELDMPLWALRAQIASAVDAVVQLERSADGVRRVATVAGVDATDDGYALEVLYTADAREPSRLRRVGVGQGAVP